MSLSESKRALAHLMAPVARGWRQVADAALAEFGVSSSAGWCLVYLDRLGLEPRQGELALLLDISQPSLVRTLDQLQAAGLVERMADADDRRSNRIALTPAGRALAGRIETRLGVLRAELFDGMPEAAIEIAVEVLELLSLRIAGRRDPSA